jgi:hypothetical protein
MAQGLSIGSMVSIGQELGTFLLGSTCCIASPKPAENAILGDQVSVGNPL